MGSLRKPLFLNAAGGIVYSEEMAAGDTAAFGGLTITGDIAMSGGAKVTGLPTPTAAGDAAPKSYIDQQIINGGHFKEMLLYSGQPHDTQGILAVAAFAAGGQPIEADTIVLTNGTATRTYSCVSGGDVTFAIGGSVAATMQNIATAINGDTSGAWTANFEASALDKINADGVVVIGEKVTSGAVSKIYGTWTTQTNATHVDFTAEAEYTKKALTALGTTAPTNSNFGFRRTKANLAAGELHWVESNDIIKGWDPDYSGGTGHWMDVSGTGGIPDATGAAGGGIKGKLTVDTDTSGLEIASGSLAINLSGTTLAIGAGGISVAGLPSLFEINSSAVSSNVTAGNLTALTGGGETSLHSHAASTQVATVGGSFLALVNLARKDPVYIDPSTGKLGKGDAATDAKTGIVGLANETKSADASCNFVEAGILTGLSGLTIGVPYYLASGGGISSTLPDVGLRVIEMGYAQAADTFIVRIRDLGKRAA